MQLYSTNHNSPEVSLKEAVLRGLAPDGGLYMPKEIPKLPQEFFDKIHTLNFQEIALEVAHALVQNDIPRSDLKKIIDESINFDAPLLALNKELFALELYHGPTLAFKDFGARFIARLVSYFSDKPLIILVATSGDTGSAVAQGFLKVPGTSVVLLYPGGKVSHIQEQQLSTLKDNISALEINGNFDDCQALVKKAFNELGLDHLNLTSANSINIARLIPQSFYYFWAYAQHRQYEIEHGIKRAHGASAQQRDESGFAGSALQQAHTHNAPIFAIPSGNFGNLTAGLIAKRMGLPVSKFVAAVNANDSFTKYLETGHFEPKPTKQTITNAMDVGNPSNFARITELYQNDLQAIKEDIWSKSFTDEQTKEALRKVYKEYNYIMDPHGAVAYLGLQEYLRQSMPAPGIFLETAHPAKFKDVVEEALGEGLPKAQKGPQIEIPATLAACLNKKKHTHKLDPDFYYFKNWLIEKFS
ncbi:threonine synthase [Candidatus Peregrinibacteria bacterium]|nr:threonine synthase [Candidatus Peregrinibacteria bacterium]